MQNLIIVTGGAVCWIKSYRTLLKETEYKIISLDNYSSGLIKNHIIHKRAVYLNGNTSNINKILEKYKNKIISIFHLESLLEFFKVLKI